jgi:hypothetical protein
MQRMSRRIGAILCLKGTESGSMFSILKTKSAEGRFNCADPFQMLDIVLPAVRVVRTSGVRTKID